VSVVTDSWFSDDDQLLAELGAALRSAQEVPAGFIEAGKSAFAWHDVDSELARLVSDSDAGAPAQTPEPAPAGLRSDGGRAEVRTMTFASDEVTIELDIEPDALRGQVVPPQAGAVQIRFGASTPPQDFPIDEVGWFVIRPLPAVPFRLSVRLSDGSAALTSWITL
jgi:hypothetical protein